MKIIEAAPRLERDAGVRLAGNLGPGEPVLRGTRGPAADNPPRAFGRGTNSSRRTAPHESLYSSGGRGPHALRSDRGPAGGLQLGRRSARWERPEPNPPPAHGVCVGRRFSGVLWKVIHIIDRPIRSIDEVEELPTGEIGELIVQGPQVTRKYVTRVQSNALAKIADAATVWHRMGDSGYLDQDDRFWFCGRVAHRVLTADGPMYPVRCEAIFNRHPDIRRSTSSAWGRRAPAASDHFGTAQGTHAEGTQSA